MLTLIILWLKAFSLCLFMVVDGFSRGAKFLLTHVCTISVLL